MMQQMNGCGIVSRQAIRFRAIGPILGADGAATEVFWGFFLLLLRKKKNLKMPLYLPHVPPSCGGGRGAVPPIALPKAHTSASDVVRPTTTSATGKWYNGMQHTT